MAYCNVSELLATRDSTLRHVIEQINVTLRSIALVVDAERRLIGTITDGDIRRAILASIALDAPVNQLLLMRGNASPVSAPVGTAPARLLHLMSEHRVRQIPLLDVDTRVVDLAIIDDLLPQEQAPLQALIMAGGAGRRLLPLTDDTPKPMLPVGGRPLMELTVERLRHAGVRRVIVATHYKPEKIVAHFGNGEEFGVEFQYLTEDSPMGTAGALGLMIPARETMLVINGDILTEIDFGAMLAFHREHRAVLTVAVRKYEMSVPYGVVEGDGPYVRTLVEKPVINLFTNAGIYLLEPSAYDHIAPGQPLDMTDLIRTLLGAGVVVVSFPVLEYWLDIGQPTDYLKAQEDVKQIRANMKVSA